MTKVKGSKKSQAQTHLHARISFLHQAATYLSNTRGILRKPDLSPESSLRPKLLKNSEQNDGSAWTSVSSREPGVLTAQLRAVSLKSQCRLSSDLKRTLCRRCNMLMKPGETCTSGMENDSRNSSKPWAQMLVIHCHFCGTKKRFPIEKDRVRQKKKAKKDKKVVGHGGEQK